VATSTETATANLTIAVAGYDSHIIGMNTDDVAGKEDIGVEWSKGMVGWDFAVMFKIEDVQSDSHRAAATSMSKEDAHRGKVDSTCNFFRDAAGHYAFVNPFQRLILPG
jgi:hypothetical protein